MKLVNHSTKFIKLLNKRSVAISNGIFSQIFRGIGHEDYKRYEYQSDNYRNILIAGGLTAFFAYELIEHSRNKVQLEAPTPPTPPTNDIKDVEPGLYQDGLPDYSHQEVAKHLTLEDQVWVFYKRGVYDVTEYISKHPDRDQMLLAAGCSVDPFWPIYVSHDISKAWKTLESMRIGNLSSVETKHAKNKSDPFHNDPERHTILKVGSEKPFNAAVPPSILGEYYYTPNELFYVRNHLAVPDIHPETYQLNVSVEGKPKTIDLTLEQLKKFPKYTITSTLACAGNRRNEMGKIKPVKAVGWDASAIGNATWTGARLMDVLCLVGVNEKLQGYNHVKFEGTDVDATHGPYSVSIPMWRALDKRCDVILAYEMNGKPLSRDHGFPIRVIVPGVVGVRNVKWLSKIVALPNECDSPWQQIEYKGFSPSSDWEKLDHSKSPAVQELPVTSGICKPMENQTVLVEDGHITVKGYAWSGNGQKIIRVDLSIDGGHIWHVASLHDESKNIPPRHWGWALWSAKIPIPAGTHEVEIWSKAVDSCYNVQPDTIENIWNLKGLLNNAYHRVKVNLHW